MDETDSRFQINSSSGSISLREGEIDYDDPVNDREFVFTASICVITFYSFLVFIPNSSWQIQ